MRFRARLLVVLFGLTLTLGWLKSFSQAHSKSVTSPPRQQPIFVLIHSPLVGPLTWQLVAHEMRRRKLTVVVPILKSLGGTNTPYWKQHANAVAQTLEGMRSDRPLILVAHSGAGMLLPAIREVTKRRVLAYVFVDAMIPEHMKSRLDLFGSAEAADRFRRNAKNGYLPTWTEQDLRDDIRNARVRRRFVKELEPLPLNVYEEPIPVFAGWPDAPCLYLQFTRTYDVAKRQAQSSGWMYSRMDGEHFLMLVKPKGVTTTLLKMLRQAGIKLSKSR